ncbi:AAA family ATPase, partial [Streptomyces sp. LP11]
MFVVPAEMADGPLVGRDRETAQLADAIGRLAAGRGAVLEITGDPGIGKTRLAVALTDLAARHGLPVLRAHALRTGATALQVFRDAGCAGPQAGERDPYETVAERAAGAVLVLEDAQWCDPASLDLLLRLVRTPARLVLAVVHRPRQSAPALLAELDQGVRTGTVTRLAPGPLDADAVAALLDTWRAPGGLRDEDEAEAGPTGPGRFSDRLAAASGGNPRHLRLLVAARWDPDQWPDRPGSDSAGMLREAAPLIAELDALGPRTAAVARTAAVLGEPFRLADVARVSGLGEEATLDAFTELVRADLMQPAGWGGPPAFRHPVIGHVAHESADLSFRLRTHRQALRTIIDRGGPAREQARHAEHLAGTDAEAADILAAGAAEVVTGAPATAARWLRLALDTRPPRDAAGNTLRLACCRALIAAGHLEEARTLAHELLSGLDPDTTPSRPLRAYGGPGAALDGPLWGSGGPGAAPDGPLRGSGGPEAAPDRRPQAYAGPGDAPGLHRQRHVVPADASDRHPQPYAGLAG